MPHEDGSAYYPIVATVSLGSSIILDVSRKDAEGKKEPVVSWRILQEPRRQVPLHLSLGLFVALSVEIDSLDLVSLLLPKRFMKAVSTVLQR